MRGKMFLISVGIFALIVVATNYKIFFGDYSVLSESTDEIEWKLHQLVNEKRVTSGLQPLAYDHDLAMVARNHSKDMAEKNYFDHTDSNGLSPSERGRLAGFTICGNGFYSGIAENIAKPYSYEVYDTVERWIDSPLHKLNIFDKHMTKEGIGVWESYGDFYITQTLC